MGRLPEKAAADPGDAMKTHVTEENILMAIQERDGVGVTVAVLSSELGYKRTFVAQTLKRLYKTAPFRLVKLTEGRRLAYRWKEGNTGERRCVCGHAWWQHEGTRGTECMAESCNCGSFRQQDNEDTETSEMTIDRDKALAFQATLLGASKVMVHFEGAMGFGNVPAKPTDFDSKNNDKLERCESLLTYQIECCQVLLEAVRNQPREEPKAAETEKDVETVIEEKRAYYEKQEAAKAEREAEVPGQAVIVWNPGTETQQQEVVNVTQIETNVYLVRHLANGSSETLFQGTSWADLVDQVLARGHRLEHLPSAPTLEEPAGDGGEAAAEFQPGPPGPKLVETAETAPPTNPVGV